MKFNKTFIPLFCFFLFSACGEKNKKSSTNEVLVEQIDLEDRLIVRLRAIVPVDDEFELFFRGEDEQFNSENKIITKVKGSNQSQSIDFALDLFEYPTNLRIDFGRSPRQEAIKFQVLSFEFNKNVHSFTSEEMLKYFRPANGLEIDYSTGEVNISEVNGKHDPYLTSYNISYFVNKLILF